MKSHYIYYFIERGHCSGHKQYMGGVYSLFIVVATNLYIYIYILGVATHYGKLVTHSAPHSHLNSRSRSDSWSVSEG